MGKGKLSKRDGEKMGFPVFPLSWNESVGYKEEGYFSEAVINFLAMLGWNPGTEQELFSLTELIESFSLERVNKSGARFDPDKTKWYNQNYLQSKNNLELAEMYCTILKEKGLDYTAPEQLDHVTKIVSLIKERAVFVSDFWNLSDYFFITPKNYAPKGVKKQWKEGAPEIMNQLVSLLETIEDFSSENVENIVKSWITKQELSFGKVMPPLRLVIVGDMKGPHIFDILAMIGKKESILRIKNSLTALP